MKLTPRKSSTQNQVRDKIKLVKKKNEVKKEVD